MHYNAHVKDRWVERVLPRLGRAIRDQRERAGISIRGLAQVSHVSPRFINEVEAGRGNISVLKLFALSKSLGARASQWIVAAEKDAQSRPIALLGPRGAGKTSVGQRVAVKLGLPFVELDRRIEDAASLSLSEIFALHGEAYYRRLETASLESVLNEGTQCVIATGGGIVTSPSAMALLKARTQTIWLRAKALEHWNRVVKQGDKRPMTGRPQAMAELRRLLKDRQPLYAQADWTIDTSELSQEAVTARVLSHIR